MKRPRWKDYLEAVYCLTFDWVGALGCLYRDAHPGIASRVGEWAQVIWFRAHNNRFYDWLDADPEDAS